MNMSTVVRGIGMIMPCCKMLLHFCRRVTVRHWMIGWSWGWVLSFVWFISRQHMANLGYCHNLFIVAQRAIQWGGVKEGWCALCCQSAIQHVLQAEHTQALQKFTQVSIYLLDCHQSSYLPYHSIIHNSVFISWYDEYVPHSLIPPQLNSVSYVLSQTSGKSRHTWEWNNGWDGNISVLCWTTQHVWRSVWFGWTELWLRPSALSSLCSCQ